MALLNLYLSSFQLLAIRLLPHLLGNLVFFDISFTQDAEGSRFRSTSTLARIRSFNPSPNELEPGWTHQGCFR